VVQVSVHAIPVYDGKLISDQNSLQNLLDITMHSKNTPGINHAHGFSVRLLNEFEIPWVELDGVSYPKYKTTLKISTRNDDE